MNNPIDANENQRRSEFNKSVMNGAYLGAAAGFGTSLAGILAASRFFPKFANQPVQLKAWLMTFSTAAGFAFGGEKAIFFTPHSTFYKYFERKAALDDSKHETHSDSALKDLAVSFQNNKKKIFATVGVGAIGASMYYFIKRKDIPWNQKLMQTRVLAQGAVVGVIFTLAAVQAFSDYLEFKEPKVTGEDKVIEVQPHLPDASVLGPPPVNRTTKG